MDQRIELTGCTMADQANKRMRLHEAICSCGATFKYRRETVSRRVLCGECTVTRAIQGTTRVRRIQRERVRALPKPWTVDERRAYVSAEGHLTKTLVQLREMQPDQRKELLDRFMSALSGEPVKRALPPRRPQSD